MNDIHKNYNENKEVKYKEFNENDFIKLKLIYSNGQCFFYLVIHRETLYIFMMKKLYESDEIDKETQREIDFCKNCTCRYINRFYGFIKKDEKITGIIYEYLCNGSLNNYVKNFIKKLLCNFIWI